MYFKHYLGCACLGRGRGEALSHCPAIQDGGKSGQRSKAPESGRTEIKAQLLPLLGL